MTPSSRDRISVDLHGLKAALFERAQALGVSPSGLVRTTLAEALGRSDPTDIDRLKLPRFHGHLMINEEGVRNAHTATAVSGGVSSADG